MTSTENTVPIQCVILVGGMGTRLGALTTNCPKPLLDIAGKPFLTYLIEDVRRFGFSDIVLLAGYNASIVDEFAAEFPDVRVIKEATPAGTAGALLNAKKVLRDQFLLINGDSYFDFNMLDLVSRQSNDDWIVRLSLRRVSDATRYGSILKKGNKITGFQEKNSATLNSDVNCGVYLMKKKILKYIDKIPSSLEFDVFPVLAKKQLLEGYTYEGSFIDIGIPQDYIAAQNIIPAIQKRPAVFLDRDGTVNVDPGYTHDINSFKWQVDTKQAIKAFNDLGYYVFIVTNQAGIARGYYSEEIVRKLHYWMNNELRASGAHIDEFVFCPHHPEAIIEKYRVICNCRKPSPGLVEGLLSKWSVERSRSFFVGDQVTDLEVADAVGINGLLIDHNGGVGWQNILDKIIQN